MLFLAPPREQKAQTFCSLLCSIDISSTNSGSPIIWFSDKDFGPLPAAGCDCQSDIGGTTVGTVFVKMHYDAGDTVDERGNPFVGTLATTQSFNAYSHWNNYPFSGTANSVSPGALSSSPYSLTQVVVIIHTGKGDGRQLHFPSDTFLVIETQCRKRFNFQSNTAFMSMP